MKPLQELTRPNIWALKPYSSARDEYSGKTASVFLDANENPYNAPNNRYPDPLQKELKALIAPVKKVKPEQIFLGNGSDEAIDLLFRAFCRPGIDNVVAIHPTYGMYQVCADINDVEYRKVLLDEKFQFKAEDLLRASDENTKLIFLCSPNNPTGNNLDAKEIIGIFTKIKYPYNINLLTQQEALRMMQRHYEVQRWISTLLEERTRLMKAFAALPCCKKVFPTDANFFLARVTHAKAIYDYLVDQGIIVRNRSSVTLCEDCLRITVGTRPENDTLLEALRKYTE